jgi:predicted flap endonuclease-1-like 5' DNA nuclease
MNHAGYKLAAAGFDPELPFGIGPVNAREVQESGLWPTATVAAAVGRSRTQIEEARAARCS